MSTINKTQTKKINSIRTFLLLEEDKEIKNSINECQMRINGLTSKEFMEKNRMDYIVSINNGIIYDCYKLPKNEEIQCDILGKFCNKINLDFHRIKKKKMDLGLRKNNNFLNQNKNDNEKKDEEKNKLLEEEIGLNRKKTHLNSVKENINFLKRISFCLKSPIKEKIKGRKSVGDIPTKMIKDFKKKLHSNENISIFSPKKKRATRNLKKFTINLKKIDKDIFNNYYNNNYYLINGYHRSFV